MFFVLSKVAGFFAVPSNLIALAGLAGLCLLLARRWRAGLALLIVSTVLLAIAGFSPLGNVLLLALTERFPQWQSPNAPDGIIVLGGAIDSEASAARNSIELDASAERILAMLRLARRFPQAKIVFSGGSGNLFMGSVSEAPIAAQLLRGVRRQPRPHRARRGLTDDSGKRDYAARDVGAEARRALAARHFGVPYAARDRRLSQSGL